jgi:hypothetical protein
MSILKVCEKGAPPGELNTPVDRADLSQPQERSDIGPR